MKLVKEVPSTASFHLQYTIKEVYKISLELENVSCGPLSTMKIF
jgi:hypothetical protein